MSERPLHDCGRAALPGGGSAATSQVQEESSSVIHPAFRSHRVCAPTFPLTDLECDAGQEYSLLRCAISLASVERPAALMRIYSATPLFPCADQGRATHQNLALSTLQTIHGMSTQSPDTISTPNHQTDFATPEFRTKVIEVLSRTANGCLQELNYSGMAQQVGELGKRVRMYQDENSKLFEDNQKLATSIQQLRERAAATEKMHKGRIQSLEQQVEALQRENQECLLREHNLAAGHPDYARLHADLTRVHSFCAQLRQQVAMLHKFLAENQHAALSGRPVVAAAVAPPPQFKTNATQSTQQTIARQQQQQPISRRPDQVQNPTQASQRVLVHQPRPQAIHPLHHPTSNLTGAPLAQHAPGAPSAITLQSSPVSPHMNMNQIVPSNRTFAQATGVSRPSSSTSRRSNDTMEIDQLLVQPQGARAMPVIHAWDNSATPTNRMATTFHPPSVAPSRGLISGKASVQPAVADPIPTTTPRPPLARTPPQGMTVVEIGPPGQLLPPLVASVPRPPLPMRSPATLFSDDQPSARKPTLSWSPPVVDKAAKPVGTRMPSQYPSPSIQRIEDVLQMPNFIPSNSRDSPAHSEAPKMSTSPDTSKGDMVGVISGLPASESLKRGSVEEGGEGAEVRKKLKLDAEEPKHEADSSVEKVKNISGNDHGEGVENAPEEADTEGDDDDEFGPDGLRSIKACLEVFVDDDETGVPACQLCVARYASGLIEHPTTFSGATQEEMVEHFLSEHPSSWEDLLHCRNG